MAEQSTHEMRQRLQHGEYVRMSLADAYELIPEVYDLKTPFKTIVRSAYQIPLVLQPELPPFEEFYATLCEQVPPENRDESKFSNPTFREYSLMGYMHLQQTGIVIGNLHTELFIHKTTTEDEFDRARNALFKTLSAWNTLSRGRNMSVHALNIEVTLRGTTPMIDIHRDDLGEDVRVGINLAAEPEPESESEPDSEDGVNETQREHGS